MAALSVIFMLTTDSSLPQRHAMMRAGPGQLAVNSFVVTGRIGSGSAMMDFDPAHPGNANGIRQPGSTAGRRSVAARAIATICG
jgi:hypothetical protein